MADLSAQIDELHAKIADLQVALQTCRVIGMAIGIVMHQHPPRAPGSACCA